MEQIIIEQINIESRFRYLWLKYILDFDLNNHCAKCFIGAYSQAIKNTSENQTNITLNESKYRYLYLCGVSEPFNYNNNFHLAIKYKKGEILHIQRNGINIKLLNAIEIDIKKKNVYTHHKGHLKAFNTCRNWQFAYQQTN